MTSDICKELGWMKATRVALLATKAGGMTGMSTRGILERMWATACSWGQQYVLSSASLNARMASQVVCDWKLLETGLIDRKPCAIVRSVTGIAHWSLRSVCIRSQVTSHALLRVYRSPVVVTPEKTQHCPYDTGVPLDEWYFFRISTLLLHAAGDTPLE